MTRQAISGGIGCPSSSVRRMTSRSGSPWRYSIAIQYVSSCLPSSKTGRDVGVRDARRDARLVEEHVDEALVLDQVRVDALDGDPLLEAAGPVDRAPGARSPSRRRRSRRRRGSARGRTSPERAPRSERRPPRAPMRRGVVGAVVGHGPILLSSGPARGRPYIEPYRRTRGEPDRSAARCQRRPPRTYGQAECQKPPEPVAVCRGARERSGRVGHR